MNAKYLLLVREFSRLQRFKISVATLFVAALGILGGAKFAFAGETLHVVERELTNTTIHLGAKGEPDSVGDMIVFANPIFDSTNARQLGIVQGNCVRVIVGQSWECFFTLVLANAHVTLEGP